MSLGVLRFVLSLDLGRGALRPILLNSPLARTTSCQTGLSVSFSTHTESEETDAKDVGKAPKKLDPRARVTFGSVGRKISLRHIQLLGQDGEELGLTHRADVIRMMDQTGLKLVVINDKCDPPLYRLMNGKQIHEEQMKLRETQKNKKGPVQSKELTFSSDISHHDLDIKLRQIGSWVEKNNHVRVTIKAGTDSSTPLDRVLTHMVEKITVPVSFISQPSVIRGGRAAMCVLRLASAKEQQKREAEASRKNKKPDTVEETHRDDVSKEPTD